MTLTLRPRGRGNWRVMRMRLEGERGGLLIAVGEILVLGGVEWRICSIGP